MRNILIEPISRDMLLYKYTSAAVGQSILVNHSIRFTPLDSLNDRFEPNIPIKNTNPDESFGSYFESLLSNQELINYCMYNTAVQYYEQNTFPLALIYTQDEFLNYVENGINGGVELEGQPFLSHVFGELRKRLPTMIEGIRERLPGLISKQVTVSCFTKLPNHQSMWCLYADDNNGIVLGFDGSHSFFEHVFPIKYQDERDEVTIERLTSPDATDIGKCQLMFGTKHTHWAYEEEYRIFRGVNILTDIGNKDKYGNPILVQEFPYYAIKEVIFGLDTPANNIENILTILNQPEYQHVQIQQIHINMETNQLDPKPYAQS